MRRVQGQVARRRGGPQTVPDCRTRVGHRQPDVLPTALRERDMVVGRQRPVSPDRVQVGVYGPGLPSTQPCGARLRRVRVRVEEQLCRLRAQRDRFDGRVHHYRASDRSAIVACYEHHRRRCSDTKGDRGKFRVTGKPSPKYLFGYFYFFFLIFSLAIYVNKFAYRLRYSIPRRKRQAEVYERIAKSIWCILRILVKNNTFFMTTITRKLR